MSLEPALQCRNGCSATRSPRLAASVVVGDILFHMQGRMGTDQVLNACPIEQSYDKRRGVMFAAP